MSIAKSQDQYGARVVNTPATTANAGCNPYTTYWGDGTNPVVRVLSIGGGRFHLLWPPDRAPHPAGVSVGEWEQLVRWRPTAGAATRARFLAELALRGYDVATGGDGEPADPVTAALMGTWLRVREQVHSNRGGISSSDGAKRSSGSSQNSRCSSVPASSVSSSSAVSVAARWAMRSVSFRRSTLTRSLRIRRLSRG